MFYSKETGVTLTIWRINARQTYEDMEIELTLDTSLC